MKIIDCTIRDGGLLNDWNFSDNIVKIAYLAAEKAGVDYFEIGYKNDLSKHGMGAYGYCDNNFINSLFKRSPNLKLLCMIDVNKYTGYEICPCGDSANPFAGIRVASYPDDVEKAIVFTEKLHKLGYEVFFQMMASSEWTDDKCEVLRKWDNKNILQAIYFADSFGAFMPADISVYVNRLRDLGFTNIGFHPHNNLQMSFANALEAMRVGASFVDATIYGMGRGSGNLPIEILLSYLHKNGETKYNVAPYLDVIERFFLDLMKEYKWGYSLKSLFGGIKNIHPYYVSEVFKQGFYTADEMWSLFDGIKEKCPVSFSKEHLKNALEERFYMPTIDQAKDIILEVAKEAQIIPVEDAFSLNNLPIMNRHKNKKFLIIANGPSVNTYNSQIREYAKNKELVTIGCNYLTNIFEPDYHTFVSKKRFLKYSNAVSEKSLLLVPSFFGKQIVKDNYDRPVEYIEMVSTGDLITKPIDGIKQQHVYLNVAIAAILTAYQMGAEEIMVAGMDGYEKEDSKEIKYFYNEEDVHDDKVVASLRYDYLVVELKRVSDYLYEQGVPLSIITPTSHKKYYKNVLNINL